MQGFIVVLVNQTNVLSHHLYEDICTFSEKSVYLRIFPNRERIYNLFLYIFLLAEIFKLLGVILSCCLCTFSERSVYLRIFPNRKRIYNLFLYIFLLDEIFKLLGVILSCCSYQFMLVQLLLHRILSQLTRGCRSLCH